MESFPEMTNKVTTLVRATGIEDPGRMNDAGTQRRDPEVSERARRRTFTAKYKLRSWPLTTPPPKVKRVRCCVGRVCTPATLCRGGGLAMPARWRGWTLRADVSGATPKPSRSPALSRRKHQLEQELAKTRFVVDVQAKLHALLETLSESAEPENGSMT